MLRSLVGPAAALVTERAGGVGCDGAAVAAPLGGASRRPKRLRLLRYFVTASVLTLACVTAVVGWVFAAAARRDFVKQGESFASSLVRHMSAGLEERIGQPMGALVSGWALGSGDRTALVDRAVRAETDGLGVRRVVFFDLGGRVTYASAPELIGQRARPDSLFWQAKGGEARSRVVDPQQALDGGASERAPLLESYLPARDAGGDLVGVVEVYQDASGLVDEIRATTLRVGVVSAVSTLVTVAVLFVVFLRGDRAIQSGTAALYRANAALSDLSANLEREVGARTAQLFARERLARLGALASGIAHEVNNPLAAIASAAEALLRLDRRGGLDGLGGGDPRVTEYLEIIRDEAFRAKAITRDLLRTARSDDAEQSPLQVNEVVREVTALLERLGGERGAALRLDLAPDAALPPVLGNAGRLRQVVFNLTDNALDALEALDAPGAPAEAMPADAAGAGGPARARARVTWRTRLEAGAEGSAPTVVLRCEDDGPGLPPAVRARLFEPFVTTKEPGRGTGLGLAICRGIVEGIGGTIAVEDREGARGTVVTVRLPVADGAAPPPPSRAAAAAGALAEAAP